MILRADLATQRGVVVPVPAPRRDPLAQATIVPVAEGIAGIIFDLGPQRWQDARRLAARLDGAPLGGPLISTRLELRGGGERHLLLVRQSADRLIDRSVELSLGGLAVAAIDPSWLQSPLGDGADVIEGLTDRGRRRLLTLFLTTGPSLFGFEGAAEFSAAAGRVMDLLGLRPVAPICWSPLGSRGRILSYRIPATVEPRRIGELVTLAAGRVARARGCRLAVEAGGDGRLLHVFLPRPLAPGATLVGLGETPAHLASPGAGIAPQPLDAWLDRRDGPTKAWACALVEAEAARDPAAAALMRELRHGGAAESAASVRHLSGTPAGLLYALDLGDPQRLLRAVRLERGEAAVEIELGTGPRRHDAPLVGFAALARGSWFDDACRIRVIYHSGRVRTVHEGRPEAFKGLAPRCFLRADAPAAVEALAAARLSMERSDPGTFVEDFGAASSRLPLSIVAAIGGDLDLVRVRAAMLVAEAGAACVELVYHVPAGELATAARAAIADAAAVYGAPHRLVTTSAAADASSRLVAALGATRGAAALLLGAEALPVGRGWLAPWLRALARGDRIVGGALVDVDGAVIDAGVSGSRASDLRRAQGMPASGLPRAETARTNRVIADCVGLTRPALESLLATAVWHPEPEVMLAQAVARLQRTGGAHTLLRGRFVRYGAAPARDALTQAADARAIAMLLKRSFSVVGDEGAS